MKRGLVTRAAAASLSFAIRSYRAVVSPWLPARCRFAPSCSEYALDAIATHGPWTGSLLAAARLARCHPWHPGGHDPVPRVAPADHPVRMGASSDRASASCTSPISPHRH